MAWSFIETNFACAGLLDVSKEYGFAPLAVFCTPGAVRGAKSDNVSVIQWWRDVSGEGQNAQKAADLLGRAAQFVGLAGKATPSEQSATVVKTLASLKRIRSKLDVLKTQINKKDSRGRTIITSTAFSRMSRDWHVQMSVIAKGIEVPQQKSPVGFGLEPATATIVGIGASVALIVVAICYLLNQKEITRQEAVINARIALIPEADRAQVLIETAATTGQNPLVRPPGDRPSEDIADLLKGATGLIVAGAAVYVGVVFVVPMLTQVIAAKKS